MAMRASCVRFGKYTRPACAMAPLAPCARSARRWRSWLRHELVSEVERGGPFTPARPISGFVTGEQGLGHAVLIVPDLDATAKVRGIQTYQLQGFEEKPDADRAALLYSQLGVAWNAGIFMWQRRAIRDAIDRYTGLVTMIGAVTPM